MVPSLAVETWIYLVWWLVLDVLIYCGYGRSHSRLDEKHADQVAAMEKIAGP